MALFYLSVDVESMVSLLMDPIHHNDEIGLSGIPGKRPIPHDIYVEGKRIQSLWIRLTDDCLAGSRFL